jgi:hypothetical protein
MLKIDIKLDGVDDFLNRLDKTKSNSIKLNALGKAAKVIKEAVSENAPMRVETSEGSDALPPGALKDGLEIYKSRNNGYVKVQFKKTKFQMEGRKRVGRKIKGLVSDTGTGALRAIAHLIEYGFSHVGGKFVGPHIGFFRRGVDESTEAATKVLEAELQAGIEKTFNSGSAPQDAD